MSQHSHLFNLHLSKKRRKTAVDQAALVASFLYPLSGVPQVVQVFHGSTAGVSLLSWTGFTVFSLLFLFYGAAHRIKPMIITNFIWVIVDLLVVIGTLAHRMM